MSYLTNTKNVVLIGMPGVGKSTIGVLLAKAMAREFIDTDLLIQSAQGRRLQEVIEDVGLEAFKEIEERLLLSIDHVGALIATGGSAVYSEKAMTRFGETGVIVHFHLPLAELESRINDFNRRGVVIVKGKTFAQLYAERMPLYKKYRHITLDCTGLSPEGVLLETLRRLIG